jgi:hypothetical protein
MNILRFLFFTLFLIKVTSALASDACNQIIKPNFFNDFDKAVYDDCVRPENQKYLYTNEMSWSAKHAETPLFFSLVASGVEVTNIDTFFDAFPERNYEAFLYNTLDKNSDNFFEFSIKNNLSEERILRVLSLDKNINIDLEQIKNKSGLMTKDELADMAALFKVHQPNLELPRSNLKRYANRYLDQLALFYPEQWSDVYDTSFIASSFDCSLLKNKDASPQIFAELTAAELINCDSDDLAKVIYNTEDTPYLIHKLAKYNSDPDTLDVFLRELGKDRREQVLNHRNIDNFTAIHTAVKYSDNPSIITHLIAWGADVNEMVYDPNNYSIFDRSGTRPMHLAAERIDPASFKILLRLIAHGAKIFEKNRDGLTAFQKILIGDQQYFPKITLMLYAQEKDIWLADYRGSVADQTNKSKNPASLLFLDSFMDKEKKILSGNNDYIYNVLREVVRYGAKPDLQGPTGYSALIFYARFGTDADTFALLMSSSQNACSIQAEDGVTVRAAIRGNNILKNSRTKNNQTPNAIYTEKCNPSD